MWWTRLFRPFSFLTHIVQRADFQATDVASEEDCADLCANTSNCTVYTYMGELNPLRLVLCIQQYPCGGSDPAKRGGVWFAKGLIWVRETYGRAGWWGGSWKISHCHLQAHVLPLFLLWCVHGHLRRLLVRSPPVHSLPLPGHDAGWDLRGLWVVFVWLEFFVCF